MNKPKILLLVATHGDEGFSIPVVKKLSKKYSFDWIIANPKAYALNTRYIQADLNRCGPGFASSSLYEEKRAYKLIERARQYDFVLDIHGTVSDSGLFVIISDPCWQNIEFSKKINLANVVLWPSLHSRGPLTQFIPNSLEIECGRLNTPSTANKLYTVLSDFFEKKQTTTQNYYIVTGQLPKSVDLSLNDFVTTTYQNQTFTPLLVDQYPTIKCYCLQPLQNTLSFINTKE